LREDNPDTKGGFYAISSANDLALAKGALFKDGLTLVLAKNAQLLYKSKSHGVIDMIAMIDELGELTQGASLADSVVGRAAALLCVYSGIANVYGSRMSEGALSTLKARGIHHEFGELVPRILNRKMDDVCPFDKAVSRIEDPMAALERLRSVRL
jgi:hypothetical protein